MTFTANLLRILIRFCELKIQDVVIPKKAAEYFVQISGFIDELLTKVYKLPSNYNVKSTDDLYGQLIMGLAPHTCVSNSGKNCWVYRPQRVLCASDLALG